MIKKLGLLAAILLGLTGTAHAVCTAGSLPFQLQNNTIADATQVMANFNQIANSVAATCAASGANSDITSLNGIMTPLSPSSGGTYHFLGVNSTGTNALVVATTTPTFTLNTGYLVTFIAGGTNTTVATLNVNGTGVKNLFRRTQLGAVATAGGEVISGNSYEVVYDGTEYILDRETIYIGSYMDWSTTTAPPGYLIADGSAVSQTTFAGLFAVIGLTYGNPGGGNFNLPDTRGRVMAGLDNYGSGAANRLTNAATGCGTTFTALNTTCANANESHTQILAEIAAHTHTFGYSTTTFGASPAPVVTSIFTNGGNTVTTTSTGSGQAMPIVNPNYATVKVIRF